MATRFFLPATGTAPVSVTPGSHWNTTTGFATLPAPTTKSNTATAAGTARAKSGTSPEARLDRVYVSDSLAAQTIAAGTFSAVIKGLESGTSTNAWLDIAIRVVSSDGATERGVVYAGSPSVTESATVTAEAGEFVGTAPAATRIKSALTTTAVTAQQGDRVVIEVGYKARSTNTGNNVTLTYGDPTAAADFALTAGLTTDLCPWVELSQTLTFGSAGPTTYYISAAGASGNSGLSTAAPKTFADVAGLALNPGDSVLFRGGDTFTGQIYIGAGGLAAGTAALPITYGSYGTGRATITNSSGHAFNVYNVAGLVVRDLILAGTGTAFTNSSGISLYKDTAGRVDYVLVDNVESYGWQYGISIGGSTGGNGFSNVTVTNSVLRNNRDSGLLSYGPSTFTASQYSHTSITVTGCAAYDNEGNSANTTGHSGNGILLGSVSGGLIDQCRAYSNGSLNGATTMGPVGLWAYDADSVVISRSVSYDNHSGTTADGGGFDLDMNVSNSRVEYCLAYANDGAGILLFGNTANTNHTGNVVRYNLLWGNGRSAGGYGDLTVYGNVRSTTVFGNTVVSITNGTVQPSPVWITTGTPFGNTFRNNIFLAQSTAAVVKADTALASTAALFQGNAYHSTGTLGFTWGGSTYATLAAWRAAAANQETVSGSASGVVGDPLLVTPDSSPTVTDPTVLTGAAGLQLQVGSPVSTAGLDLATLFSADMGTRDYFGNTLTSPYSVGAAEQDTAAGVSVERTPADVAAATDAAAVVSSASSAAADVAAATDAVSTATSRAVTDAAGAVDAVTTTLSASSNPADAAAATDTVTSLTVTRAAADSAGGVDAASAVQALTQTVGDAAGAVDSVSSLAPPAVPTGVTATPTATTAAISWSAVPAADTYDVVVTEVALGSLVASGSDSAGAVDAATAVQSQAVLVADTAGTVDVGTPVVAAARAAADAADVVDSASAQLTATQTPADVAAGLDAASAVQGLARPVADVAAGTDATSAVQAQVQTYADTAAVVDAASAVQALAQSVSDAAGAVDAASSVGAAFVTVTDSAGVVDATSAARSTTAADAAGAVDTATAVQAAQVTVTDTAGAVDAVSVNASGVLSATAADAAGAVDVVSATANSTRTVTDAAAATDAVAAIFVVQASPADIAAGTDAATAVQAVTRVPADAAAGVDAATWTAAASATPTDAAAAVDVATATQAATRTVADTAGGTDAVTANLTQLAQVTAADTADVTDAAAAALARTASSADTAGAVDAVSYTMVRVVFVTDTADASDAAVQQRTSTRLVTDTAAVTDAAQAVLANAGLMHVDWRLRYGTVGGGLAGSSVGGRLRVGSVTGVLEDG